MKKGRIIFLNGVTSAGKTSIVEAIQVLFVKLIGASFVRLKMSFS